MTKFLRWGILGCGLISHDFVRAMRMCERPNKVAAVATANSLERAQEFANKLKLDDVIAYGSYEELLKDQNVDIVYIGILNEAHCEWVCNVAAAKKHILCEKPFAGTVEEVKRMIEAQKQHDVFMMEAFWTRFFPAQGVLQDVLKSKEFGEVKSIVASYGTSTLPDNRTDLEISECPLNDIGSYLVQFALMCANDQRPTKVHIEGAKNKEGSDISGNITLEFEDGKIKAYLVYTIEANTTNNACISFENGICEFPEFFNAPQRIMKIKGKLKPAHGNAEMFEFPFKDNLDEYNFSNSSGLRYEADHCYDLIQKGCRQSEIMPLETTLRVTEVVVELRKQMGVTFPADKAVKGS
ncbi:oxidoreductase family, NAD-binding rossmann fold domain-containing protein [Ditylenchus destructor]|nr:oxidoreductase family, NAD-binding rossmann fold domain-containing protein [Ditylenchus destructor]